ncbi:MAG TPA: cobaltochelatase subunit CobT, partial [Brevundimonas sp.]|nr:cobaltochelatase subunit CobT [Brevundimonas sp.]
MERARTSAVGAGHDDGPVDVFKRSLAAAVRAVAEKTDLAVGYAAGQPGYKGKEVRLPLPPRHMDSDEVTRLRGSADAVALRLRFHDDAVHARRQPAGKDARDAYNAVEQARVEALGSRLMPGVAANIAGWIDLRCKGEGFDRATSREQVPLSEALR